MTRNCVPWSKLGDVSWIPPDLRICLMASTFQSHAVGLPGLEVWLCLEAFLFSCALLPPQACFFSSVAASCWRVRVRGFQASRKIRDRLLLTLSCIMADYEKITTNTEITLDVPHTGPEALVVSIDIGCTHSWYL